MEKRIRIMEASRRWLTGCSLPEMGESVDLEPGDGSILGMPQH
jgi:hypothetical protein